MEFDVARILSIFTCAGRLKGFEDVTFCSMFVTSRAQEQGRDMSLRSTPSDRVPKPDRRFTCEIRLKWFLVSRDKKSTYDSSESNVLCKIVTMPSSAARGFRAPSATYRLPEAVRFKAEQAREQTVSVVMGR